MIDYYIWLNSTFDSTYWWCLSDSIDYNTISIWYRNDHPILNLIWMYYEHPIIYSWSYLISLYISNQIPSNPSYIVFSINITLIISFLFPTIHSNSTMKLNNTVDLDDSYQHLLNTFSISHSVYSLIGSSVDHYLYSYDYDMNHWFMSIHFIIITNTSIQTSILIISLFLSYSTFPLSSIESSCIDHIDTTIINSTYHFDIMDLCSQPLITLSSDYSYSHYYLYYHFYLLTHYSPYSYYLCYHHTHHSLSKLSNDIHVFILDLNVYYSILINY